MKMLILEDDLVSRLVLQRMLVNSGNADVAVNWKEALALFIAAHNDGTPYEVIFLDLMVPEMGGQTVLREMRAFERQKGIAREQGAKIVVMTALSDKENVVAAIESGCDSYLVKPLRAEQVHEHLRKLGKIS